MTRQGVDLSQYPVGATEEAIGWRQAIDPHMGAALVVFSKELLEPLLGVTAVFEVLEVPQLTAQRPHRTLDFAATLGAIGLANDMGNVLRLQDSPKVALASECHERASPVGAHRLRLAMASDSSAERFDHDVARR